jgi:hypothetical protein
VKTRRSGLVRQYTAPYYTTPSETARRLMHARCPHCSSLLREQGGVGRQVHFPDHCPALAYAKQP